MLGIASLLLAAQAAPATGTPLVATAAVQPSARAAFSGVLAAAETCFGALETQALDAGRLRRDGWREEPIDNAENAPTRPRLFAKARAGALILVHQDAGGRPWCQILVVRAPEGTEALAAALIEQLGGAWMAGDQGMGEGASVMRVPNRPFLLLLRRQPDDRDVMAQIQIMPTEGR